ncbi:MAG: NAD(P)/FAD-dependent oxidoreductase [Proteobacteria bacterium]|nr:NAD(P)/FAD-dependent oxidoreductase [Pseudomonadota bacterium]
MKMPMQSSASSEINTNVVVIGGGHNGLVASCYLAKAGHNVVVVEAQKNVGGMTASGPFIKSAPKHIIHPCAVDAIFIRTSSIIEDLDLRKHGFITVDPNPSYAYLSPEGESIAFWSDPSKTADEIRRYSPSDARAYLEFANTLEALLGVALPMMRSDPRRPSIREVFRSLRSLTSHRKRLGEIGALALGTADQAVCERFDHPFVIAALLGLAGGAGPIDADGSGLAHIIVALLHRVGVGRPVGGMQSLAESLKKRLYEGGGSVLTGTPVEEILVTKGHAEGVRLADGRIIKADSVLAACDPRTALGSLLPDGAIDRRMKARVDHIPANARGAAPMKIDLALKGRVQISKHQKLRKDGVDLRVPALIIGTAEEIRSSFANSMRGELTPGLYYWAAVPTACDPSQAPDGQDVLYLYPPAVPAYPAEGWQSLRKKAENIIMSEAMLYFDNLDSLEIGRWVETPKDLCERTGAVNGCVTHVDFALLRSGPLRPAWGLGGYVTPVKGLFLGAAGSHPGGAVSGLPGKLASARVIRYLARCSR